MERSFGGIVSREELCRPEVPASSPQPLESTSKLANFSSLCDLSHCFVLVASDKSKLLFGKDHS